MDIENYKSLCNDEKIVITQHAYRRFRERNIFLDDIENAILSGEIIEEYPNDEPFPSCLILGRDTNNFFFHIVASTDENSLYIITAYRPDSAKWEEDFKTRRQ